MFLSAINWIGVAVAFVVYFILGAVWFTVLLKKPYRLSLGKENESEQPLAPIFIVGPAICSLIITIATSVLMYALPIHTLPHAVIFALLIGVGYLVANTVNIAINPNIPRPLLYGAVSGSYHLVGIVLVSIIIFVMK